MAFVTSTPNSSSMAWIGRIIEGVSYSFNMVSNSKKRLRHIEKLNAKSDAELAEIGLARDQIIAHVFKDVM